MLRNIKKLKTFYLKIHPYDDLDNHHYLDLALVIPFLPQSLIVCRPHSALHGRYIHLNHGIQHVRCVVHLFLKFYIFLFYSGTCSLCSIGSLYDQIYEKNKNTKFNILILLCLSYYPIVFQVFLRPFSLK